METNLYPIDYESIHVQALHIQSTQKPTRCDKAQGDKEKA